MRISDWSSDVCSSDLDHIVGAVVAHAAQRVGHARRREDVADVREIAVRLIEIAPLGEIGDELLAKDVHAIFEGRHLVPLLGPAPSSEARRVGNEWFSTCTSRWSPYQ